MARRTFYCARDRSLGLRNLWTEYIYIGVGVGLARDPILGLVDLVGFCLSQMAKRMSELTEEEKARLPYMTNELYDKNHSVIAKHFPIKQDVGRRLVDSGLLTTAEYLEISGFPVNAAGSCLISTLTRKGDDSMRTFYKVLLSARGERDVDVVLHSLEVVADLERRSKEVSEQVDCTLVSPLRQLIVILTV